MKLLRGASVVCLAGGLASCGGQGSVPAATARPASSSAAKTKPVSGWHYHPRISSKLRARVILTDGRWLLVGDGGERWLANPRTSEVSAAPQLADEDLVVIPKADGDGYEFVGSKGSLYRAREPLGTFAEVKRPEKQLRAVAGQGKALLGVLADGSLVRSEDGARTFVPTKYEGNRLVDFAMSADGRALLLGMPEQIWQSKDGGKTLERVANPGIGALATRLDASGDPVVQGILKSLVLRRTAEAPEPAVGPIESSNMELFDELKPGPSGPAVVAGSATIDGTDYVEAIQPRAAGRTWSLAQSGLLQRSPVVGAIPGTEDCVRIAVGASGKQIALACLTGGQASDRWRMRGVRLFVSVDGGASFRSKGTGLVADETVFRIRLLPSGNVLLTGTCRTGARRNCRMDVPYRLVVRNADSSLHLESADPVTAPPVAGHAGGIEISPDGKRTYWSARLGGNRDLALMISDDDGSTFKPVVLETTHLGLGKPDDVRALLQTAQSDWVGIDESGYLSWTLTTQQGPLWIVLDGDGHARTAKILPKERPQVAAAGRHGLGFDPASGVVQMSNDGGSSFSKLARMPSLLETGRSAVVCRAAGCLIGASFSWTGWTAVPGGLYGIDEDRNRPSPHPRWLTPLVCKVREPTWHRIGHVDRVVTAYEADRGSTAWTAAVEDSEHHSVSLAIGHTTPIPHVRMLTVLEPTQSPDVAIGVHPQAEGVAAIRFSPERDGDGDVRAGAPLRDVEVAWVNLFDGTGVRRARIKNAGKLEASDASRASYGSMTAAAQIVSVAAEGIYVCPHDSCEGSDDRTVFVDLRGRTHSVSVPKWPTVRFGDVDLRSRGELLPLETGDTPIALLEDNRAVLRARTEAGTQKFDTGLGLLPDVLRNQGYRAQFSWAFNRTPAPPSMAVSVVHKTEPAAYAGLLTFRGRDAVAVTTSAPLQVDAGDPPRSCTRKDKDSTFRIIAPVSGQARHPIRIDFPGKFQRSVWLLSDDAVMYGAGGSGCVSMLDTIQPEQPTDQQPVRAGRRSRLVDSARSSRLHALVDVSSPQTSWLFDSEEVHTDDGTESRQLQWRTMECAFDPSTKPPAELEPNPGVIRRD